MYPNSSKYYLYIHIRHDKNEVFYVGIGMRNNYQRAYDKGNNRNFLWNRIVSKTTYDIEILFDNMTKEEAFAKEIELISFYGRRDLKKGTLANLSDGGEGLLGKRGVYKKKNRRKLTNKIWAINPNTLEEIKLFSTSDQIRKFLGKSDKFDFSNIYSNLYGKNKIAYGYLWKIENYKEIGIELIPYKNTKIIPTPKKKQIINTLTGKIYSCVADLIQEKGFKKSTIVGKLCGRDKNNTEFKYLN